MKLKDMITTLRTRNERIEIRDEEGNELITAPQDSDMLKVLFDSEIIEWFPHGAPGKDATFTVFIIGAGYEQKQGH